VVVWVGLQRHFCFGRAYHGQPPGVILCSSRLPSVLPPSFEPGWCQLGVANRVLDVLVPEVGLERARVPAGIRLVESTGVSKHVGVGFDLEPSSLASSANELLKVGHCHWRSALGQE